MKMQRVKKESELPIGQVLKTAEFETVNGSKKSMTLTFSNNEVVKFAVENYSEFVVLVQEEKKKVKRWKVVANILGSDATRIFESERYANKYYDNLCRIDSECLVPAEVSVFEDDQFVSDNTSHNTLDDIPF